MSSRDLPESPAVELVFVLGLDASGLMAYRGAVRGPPVSVRVCRGTGRHDGAAHALHVAAAQGLPAWCGVAEEEADAR